MDGEGGVGEAGGGAVEARPRHVRDHIDRWRGAASGDLGILPGPERAHHEGAAHVPGGEGDKDTGGAAGISSRVVGRALDRECDRPAGERGGAGGQPRCERG